MTAHVTLVLARAANGVIGNQGGLPWRLPDDMRRFKQLTMGKPVVMGRKTWDSLPKKPLPGRENIVVTRNPDFRATGATVVRSLDEALDAAGSAPEVMIIGGAEIYRMALPHAETIELTEVDVSPEGDTIMPAFSSAQWREDARQTYRTDQGLRYSYVTLKRA